MNIVLLLLGARYEASLTQIQGNSKVIVLYDVTAISNKLLTLKSPTFNVFIVFTSKFISIMLKKLDHFGMSSGFMQLMTSYLDNRLSGYLQ